MLDECSLGFLTTGARSTQKTMFAPPPLTVPSVLKMLKDIAQVGFRRQGVSPVPEMLLRLCALFLIRAPLP